MTILLFGTVFNLCVERYCNSLATILGEKKLSVNNNNDCYSFKLKDERMCKMYKRFIFDARRSLFKDDISFKLGNKPSKRCYSNFRHQRVAYCIRLHDISGII